MSRKKKLIKVIKKGFPKYSQHNIEVDTQDNLLGYIKLLIEMDQEASHKPQWRNYDVQQRATD